MNKKWLIGLLSLSCIFATSFALASCGEEKTGNLSGYISNDISGMLGSSTGSGFGETDPDEGDYGGDNNNGSHTHYWNETETVREATCTKRGIVMKLCDGCEEVKVESTSTISHVYVYYDYNEDATCTENGTKTAYCVYACGTTDTVEAADTALGHSYTYYHFNNNATCTQNGTQTAACDRGCGTTNTIEKEDTAFGHSYTHYVSDNNAECLQDGTKTAVCDHGCGSEDTVTEEGTALAHSYTNYVSDNNATCTQDGTKTAECDNGCGETDTVIDEGSAGHIYEEGICLGCGKQKPSEGLRFTKNNNTSYSVTGIGTCQDENIIIPDIYEGLPVIAIGDYVFNDCDRLMSVVIPNSVTTIGYKAFDGCSSLISVVIPDSVTFIAMTAFYDCSSLEKVYITDIVAWFNIEFEDYNSNPLCNKADLYLNDELVTELIIPDSVTSIGNYAFVGYTNLTSVKIGDSVTSIGGSAFSNCTSLTNVDIGDSVTSIGGSAFSNCTSLTNVDIGDSVATIEGYAFINCISLTSVNIPNSVTYIGQDAFDGCKNLARAAFESTENWYGIGTYGYEYPISDQLATPDAAATFLREDGGTHGMVKNDE